MTMDYIQKPPDDDDALCSSKHVVGYRVLTP
jgi:hypothetical protein